MLGAGCSFPCCFLPIITVDLDWFNLNFSLNVFVLRPFSTLNRFLFLSILASGVFFFFSLLCEYNFLITCHIEGTFSLGSCPHCATDGYVLWMHQGARLLKPFKENFHLLSNNSTSFVYISISEIEMRLDAVTELCGPSASCLASLKGLLTQLPDLERGLCTICHKKVCSGRQ